MTNEEAIDLLDNLIGMVEDNHKSNYDTALRMAIKALSQEPICPSHGIDCEDCPAYDPCGNAISREDALMALTGEWTEITDEIIHRFIKRIKALPSVNPQPKTGHWIQTNEFFINQDGQFIYRFICSECKSLSYFRKSNKKAIGANFCPNCGCRMIEPQESEEQE